MTSRRLVALGVALALVLAACGGGSDSSNKSKNSGKAKNRTLGDCVIKPRTSCPGADLRFSDLEKANLVGADLTGADLSGADMSRANLTEATLVGAVIVNADARGVSFRGANMKNTNLTGANLTDANFRGATLADANLLGAILCRTIRTDGTIDNTSCPGPTSSTTTTTTTTTTRPGATTTKPAATTTTAAPVPAACSTDAVYGAYVAKWSTPPGSVLPATPLCSGGYASQIISVTYGGVTSESFSVFKARGPIWLGLATDIAADAEQTCANTNPPIPNDLRAALGCA